MLDLSFINENKKSKFIGKKIHYYSEIDSTNIESMRLIEAGKASSGDVVIASTQSSGKGQGQNSWISPEGNLYISIITAIKAVQSTNLLTFAAGLAVISTLQSLYNIKAELKWVNDIVFNNNKLGGILTEARTNGQTSVIITGLGLNLNHIVETTTNKDFPPISLCQILAKNIDINAVIIELLENYEGYIDLYKNSPESLLYLWKTNSYTMGKEILFADDNTIYNGRAIDVDMNGFLKIDVFDGSYKYAKCTKRANIKYNYI